MQNYPSLWEHFSRLTDWQIRTFLMEERQEKVIQSYDEQFHWTWSKRGYSDSQIEQIWKWLEETKSNHEVWKRIKEAGWDHAS